MMQNVETRKHRDAPEEKRKDNPSRRLENSSILHHRHSYDICTILGLRCASRCHLSWLPAGPWASFTIARGARLLPMEFLNQDVT